MLAEYNGEIKEYVYKGTDLEVQNSKQMIIKNSGLQASIKSWRKKGVSPSALNKYNNCSLQFYYHYIAKIRVQAEVDEYADASIMGTVIHDALDANYPIGVITEKYINNITKKILTNINNNFVEIFSEQGMQEGKNYLNLQIAHRLTKNFIKLEKQSIRDAKKQNQKIKIIEKEAELFTSLIVDGVDFKLTGKADRVDFEGDTLRIIDYKTGKVEQSDIVFSEFSELIENSKKSKAFQLLMYAYLYLKMNPHYVDLNVIAGNFSFKNLKTRIVKSK